MLGRAFRSSASAGSEKREAPRASPTLLSGEGLVGSASRSIPPGMRHATDVRGTGVAATDSNAIVVDRWQRVGEALSTERIATYGPMSPEARAQTVARYVWNTALCEALYPRMHALELSLRNSIDTRLRSVHGDLWFDSPALPISAEQKDDVRSARARLADRHKVETHDGIIAGLHLGFWTAMFRSPWERAWWVPEIVATFPHMPKGERDRGTLSYRLQRMRKLRNAISHHESIWNRPGLVAEYVEACMLCKWISPPLCCLTTVIDRFPAVLHEGPAAYVNEVAATMARPSEHKSGERCF